MKKSKSKFSKYLNGGDPKKPIQGTKEQIKAYQDSLTMYNYGENNYNSAKELEVNTTRGNNRQQEAIDININNTDIRNRDNVREFSPNIFGILPRERRLVGFDVTMDSWNAGHRGSAYTTIDRYERPSQPVELGRHIDKINEIPDQERAIISWENAKNRNIKANILPVNKTKFNTDSNYTITHGIGKDRSQVYFPDEQLLNEAVTNLRTKYPKSVQSQKSKGTANYDFPGATNDEVMKFKNGGKLRKMPDGGIIKPGIKTDDPNKVRAYQDSLQLHNLTKGIYDGMLGDMKNGVLPAEKVPYHISKMDEIIPKTDSLVNDLYDMGINYKVKGYNKVPIGSNGNFTEIGKLQKVAPMPKQPYFFKQGGKLPKHTFGSFLGENLGSIGSLAGGIALSATGAGAAVGVPMILGGASGLATGAINEFTKQDPQDTSTPIRQTYNPNPYGNSFKNGGDLTRFNGAKHEQGGIKINKLGVPVNNPNSAVAEVEGDETMRGDYIYSDTLGVDKKGQVQTNAKKVNKTFADLSKKIDNKFKGRNDEISNVTKNFMYKNLTEKNEIALQSKFQKSFSSFQKKWGGMLNKYPLGGDLTDNPFGFEQLQDNILGRGNWQPYNTNNLESGASSASDQYNFAQGILPNNNDGLTGAMGESMDVFPMKYNNSRIATMPLEDRYNEYSKMNSPASANKSTNLSTPGGEGINYADYISPALNAGFGIYNALKKPNNYLAKPNNQAIEAANQIQTEPDNTQLYNRNERSLRAANKSSGNYSGSLRNSLQANNLGIKLNADNEIGFNTQRERLDRIQSKQSLKAQIYANQNQWGEAAKSQFYAENAADRQANQEAVMTNFTNAANDISAIGRDKELLQIYKAGLKYFDYDTKTGKYIYKNNLGKVFYSSIPPQETSKVG